jgi:Protein of unknown function (DUF3795)
MAQSRKNPLGRDSTESPAFKNVKNQLAYCGLWCGSCLVGNGTVNDLARDCRKALTDYGVDDWGPKNVDYPKLLEGLSVLSSMEPCVGCLRGGGKTDCQVRACAKEKGVKECVECGSHKTCKNVAFINHMRKGGARVGMKVKNKKGDSTDVVAEWISHRC